MQHDKENWCDGSGSRVTATGGKQLGAHGSQLATAAVAGGACGAAADVGSLVPAAGTQAASSPPSKVDVVVHPAADDLPGGQLDHEAGPPSQPTVPKVPLPRKLAPRAFYKSRLQHGSAAASREQQVEDRVLRFLAHVQRRMQAGADEGSSAAIDRTWQVYPTQQPAFELADAQPGLEIFSAEYGANGKRRFIATSRAEFWRRYRDMLPLHRHYYEIIRHGAPCHLYFDLEFGRKDNPCIDGGAAVDALVSLLRDHLLATFQLELQLDWLIELDSSTDTKFSRHLLIRIPGAAFASNAHVGTFVSQLCAAAKERRGSDSRCALMVVNKGVEEALFVDPAVYTRNRAFRLYLSSKCGKQAILDNTGRFGGAGLTQQECFEASLVTNVPHDARLLRCFDESAEEAAAAATRSKRAAAVAGLQPLGGLPRGALAGGAGQVCYGPCPFPELEAFIASVSSQGGVPGQVRSWALLADLGLLIFNIRGNRYCGNVGRPHKSNGVFYVVDLKEGSWCQRCYDPDCRRYRSPLMPVPPQLLGTWQQPATPETLDCSAQHGGEECHRSTGLQAQHGQQATELNVATELNEATELNVSNTDADDDDSLMLLALDAYEQQGQQGAQRVQQAAQQAPAGQLQPVAAGAELLGMRAGAQQPVQPLLGQTAEPPLAQSCDPEPPWQQRLPQQRHPPQAPCSQQQQQRHHEGGAEDAWKGGLLLQAPLHLEQLQGAPTAPGGGTGQHGGPPGGSTGGPSLRQLFCDIRPTCQLALPPPAKQPKLDIWEKLLDL